MYGSLFDYRHRAINGRRNSESRCEKCKRHHFKEVNPMYVIEDLFKEPSKSPTEKRNVIEACSLDYDNSEKPAVGWSWRRSKRPRE